MQPSCKSCLAKQLCKLSHWTVLRNCAFPETFARNCRAKIALRSYFLSFCMGLSCKSCLMKLFFSSCMGEMQTLPSKTISQAFTWNCRAKVAFRSYLLSSELSRKSWLAKLSFKVKCRSVFPECCAVLLSNGRGLGRSLSYVGRNQISLFAMLHEALVHELPCEAISWAFAWNCRAKAALQN